jgi:hypothetical protein
LRPLQSANGLEKSPEPKTDLPGKTLTKVKLVVQFLSEERGSVGFTGCGVFPHTCKGFPHGIFRMSPVTG